MILKRTYMMDCFAIPDGAEKGVGLCGTGFHELLYPGQLTAGRHGKDGRNSPEYYGDAGQDNEPQGKGYPPSGQEENVLVAEL